MFVSTSSRKLQMGKKTKKFKDGDTNGQQDGCKQGTCRKGKKEKEHDLIDLEVRKLVLNVEESDNTDLPHKERFKREVLVDYLQRNVEKMYPRIGEETYRVPDVHINKVKEEKTTEGVSEFVQPMDTDIRSDRAHSFVSDMVYNLSIQMKKTKVGPFFIISSYQYDHFLSRLKASFEEKLCLQDVGVNFPKGSGHERGEIDILIALPKHVIFMEIKAIGDNFNDYAGDKLVPTKKNIEKATTQLKRDAQVFDHVMVDLNLESFKRTKIAALPNLEREYLTEAMKDVELKKKCQGFKFLCKEDMPKNRLSYQEDFHVFYQWWINNVFPEVKEEQECYTAKQSQGQDNKWSSLAGEQNVHSQNEVMLRSSLDEVKVIVGRYVGFMSVVKVCNNSNTKLHRIEGLMEGRHKGQMVWYVGEKFANIVLTPDQKSYLDANIRLGYLCGPPGSGKTVVLSLRARRWILNDENLVVVVNMYRGAPGRAIGKQIYKTITENSDSKKENLLRDHTMEIGVDVGMYRFCREKFVQTIKDRWKDQIGTSGHRIMFIVDETYVQSYWNSVFQTLREDFPDSAMWCAGLYGKQPDQFTSLELTKVIRCPPNVQYILSLIDWVEDRKKCYITDSTTASLPTNGPQVLTVRHQNHQKFAKLPPSQCPLCGSDLAQIFRRLQVKVPGKGHTDPDLQLWSLQCSEILILVNMPRTLYSPDTGGYLDTTVAKYKSFMAGFKDCPMLNKLNEAGYPTKVHTNLTCPDLVTGKVQDVINVTWIYTYQGLENKVIIFLPGDEAMPDNTNEHYLTDASMNIPCPGLMGSDDEEWMRVGSESEDLSMTGRGSSRNVSESGSFGEAGGSTDSDLSDNNDTPECDRQKNMTERHEKQYPGRGKMCDHTWCTCGLEESHQDQADCFKETTNDSQDGSTSSEPLPKLLEEHLFNISDTKRYTRWDKSNLFISASRCTSQLILLTR